MFAEGAIRGMSLVLHSEHGPIDGSYRIGSGMADR